MTVEQRIGQRPPTVLVIDDKDYVADMIATALELESLQTHVAYNGRDGLHQADKLALDLRVIDIMMPHLGGIELIERIRPSTQLNDMPVILISPGARPKAQLPNVTFIPKPFDMDELLEVATSTLRSGGRAA